MNEEIEIDDITDEVKNYVSTNIELLKLEATEKTSVVVSTFISNIVVILLSFFFIFFASVATSLYIGQKLQSNCLGFFIVAAAYLLLAIVLFVKRKSLIELPIRDKIIKSIFNKN